MLKNTYVANPVAYYLVCDSAPWAVQLGGLLCGGRQAHKGATGEPERDPKSPITIRIFPPNDAYFVLLRHNCSI